ncbi:MAG: Hsp20/alpha crystallin family protein [Spirochaetaceae bacterium]|nr:Hsp20/alpha crystallin family protein [Spirochaetaceae bacterium]
MYNNKNYYSMFDDFFNSFNSTASARIPRVDIYEDKEGFYLDVELPGYVKENVDLKIENHNLTIQTSDSFNKSVEEKKTDRDYLVKETYQKQSFKRTFSLPKDVEEEHVVATYTNGVLGIKIPKSQKVLTKNILISD